MARLPAILASTFLILQPVSHAQAGELDTMVNMLAMKIASIKVLSQNCKIPVDPMLEGRVIETLIKVPGLYVSDVMSHFSKSYEREKQFAGKKCYPETPDQIASSTSLYNTAIRDLRDYVGKNYQ